MPDETAPLIPWMPQSYANDNAGTDDLWLLTVAELEVVPPGTVLTSILNDKVVVGQDYIDTDTRYGYVAYGLYSTQFKH
jgi:hypothetical protein